MTKRCTRCGAEREETEFYRDPRGSGGLRSWCKICCREYTARAWHDPAHPAHDSAVASARKSHERRRQHDHPYAWTHREGDWRRRRIECIRGCVDNEGFLCRSHYQMLWDLQGGRCGLCGGLLFVQTPYPAADHEHRDPDGRGPIRGILHGGKTGCNIRILGGYERRGATATLDGTISDADAACRAYLAAPPARKLVLH